MSTTIDLLGAQAEEVSKDLKKMGGIVGRWPKRSLRTCAPMPRNTYEHSRDKIHGEASAFEHYVWERPFKSVLIAAGIGLLCGRLWMRR